MQRTNTDRRAHDRFDVVGTLWGVLELPEPARIVNASTDGLLVDSGICPVLNSAQTIRLMVEGEFVAVQTTVRHARAADPGRYLIGLQFSEIPVAVMSLLEHMSADKQIEVIDTDTTRS